MHNYPQYDPKDVKNWLTKVFGKDIIFDTKTAAGYRDHSEEKNKLLGAWTLYYTGELFLQVDLPPGQNLLFANSLRGNLERAIYAALVLEHWKKPIKDCRKAVRESGWPLPEDIIRENLSFDTALLKDLAGRMKKPAEYTGAFARAVQAAEAEWIERKEKLARRCAIAFIGREPGEDVDWRFDYRDIRNWGGNLEVALILPNAQIFPYNIGKNDRKSEYAWEDHWLMRSRELGLEGAFRYSNFSIGTHAPIEEQKLVLPGRSDMDISNKMDALLDPENLPNVQIYFNEVLAATLITAWPIERHPDFSSEFQKAWDSVKGTQERLTPRQIREDILNSDKYRQWDEIVGKLMASYPTTGAFIEALQGSTPQGQEEVYETLRKWSTNTFPLLTKAITDGKFAPALDRTLPTPTPPAM